MSRGLLSSIRARMVLLILAAAVPLLVLAVVVSWQDYALAFRVSREQTTMLRAAAVARHQAAVAGLRQMLGALADAAPVLATLAAPQHDLCTALLEHVRLIDPDRQAGLGVTDAAGRTVCQSADPAAQAVSPDGDWLAATVRAPWFGAVARDAGAALGPLQAAAGAPFLPAAAPIRRDGRFVGAVLALARVDWLGGSFAPGNAGAKAGTQAAGDAPRGTAGGAASPAAPQLWLIDPAGRVIGTDGAAPGALPPPDVLHALQRHDRVISATSAGGQPYAYASAFLGDGLRLLVGQLLSAAEAAALHTLLLRIAVILVLILAGLAAVLSGAHHAVVAPVRRLEAAVRLWRHGEAFDRTLAAGLPAELRALAVAFAEASDVLSEREGQLRRALQQQELLMQEIHHRVKNNLQIVASLLNLQASRIRQPQARTEFESTRDRVRALATLHRHLYAQGEVQTIAMRSFLGELCSQLFEAMGEPVGERIQLEIEAPELRMLSDQAVPLSLIVTEVVGNALKYAFPDGRAGRIAIRLTAEAECAELLIEDDGIGMHRGGEAPAGGSSGSGIGIQLIHGFVRQLRATLEIDESRGTRYILRLPLHRERRPDATGVPA